MADDIEVHYDPRKGVLSLTCGDEAFARLRDAIINAAGLEGAPIEGVPTGVQTIIVEEGGAHKPQSRLHDRFALLGCGLVGFAIMFVMAIGLGTIVGWLR